MCFDETTSWTTFLFGTAFALTMMYLFPRPEVIAIGILWLLVLVVQVFEAIAWRSQGTPSTNFWAAQGAMIATTLQPIIVGVVFLALLRGKQAYRSAAVILMLVYVSWLAYSMNTSPTITKLVPAEGCTNLNQSWWESFSFKVFGYKIHGGIPYLACLFCLMFLLLRPLGLMYFEITYLVVSLLVSSYVYSCGTGSMWCWMAAFAPLATMGYLYYTT